VAMSQGERRGAMQSLRMKQCFSELGMRTHCKARLQSGSSQGEVGVKDKTVSNTAGTRTQVFIVRIWDEAQEEGEREVRIQARHVLTGETRYFLAWPALTAYLAGKLDAGSSIPGE
jgi:hypothetical protein